MVDLWVGMGCQSGTTGGAIKEAIRRTLANHSLDINTVVGLATLESKVMAIEICQQHHWQLQFFSAPELMMVKVPQPVAAIANLVGTPSVAEAAACLAAGQLLIPKEIHWLEGKFITIAIGHPIN
jgi:cobalamin biosynthesis protein CbiG